jgi:hypothetical protein
MGGSAGIICFEPIRLISDPVSPAGHHSIPELFGCKALKDGKPAQEILKAVLFYFQYNALAVFAYRRGRG